MNMETREDFENHISELKKLVKLKNAAERLLGNRDFKTLFSDEYFEKEAARLVQLGGDPRLNEAQRADAIAMALATGHCKRFVQITIQMGKTAEKDIADCQENIEELEREDALDASVEAEGNVNSDEDQEG